MTLSFPFKYADETLKYGIDWAEELNGDTIVSAGCAPIAGDDISLLAFAYSATSCTFILADGSPGVHRVVCAVTTTTGEQLKCPVTVQVLESKGAHPFT
jgi:hypothetical protein